MNTQELELYQRIERFSLDDVDAKLFFSKRLARDNNWTIEYAQRVIDEYKKFAFLAIVAGHPVTPSEQVDQVWHLHLVYTRSYWEDFCPLVLQTPLHHNPTKGGQQEGYKLNDWYGKTLASYERFPTATTIRYLVAPSYPFWQRYSFCSRQYTAELDYPKAGFQFFEQVSFPSGCCRCLRP